MKMRSWFSPARTHILLIPKKMNIQGWELHFNGGQQDSGTRPTVLGKFGPGKFGLCKFGPGKFGPKNLKNAILYIIAITLIIFIT